MNRCSTDLYKTLFAIYLKEYDENLRNKEVIIKWYVKTIWRFNLIEENNYDLSCKFWWNLHIGWNNSEDSDKIKEFLLTL